MRVEKNYRRIKWISRRSSNPMGRKKFEEEGSDNKVANSV